MSSVIVAFQAKPMQPSVPPRARPVRLRALPQFPAIVTWICNALLANRAEPAATLSLDDVPPALRDQVEEETLRTLGTLDPIAEGVARRRAQQTAAEQLAKVLADATETELQDPAYLQDRGNRMADLILGRYRTQLIYGTAAAPEARN